VISVVFVCLGNICRSPTAEGVFRDLVEKEGLADQIRVDSSGTSNWHIGQEPDVRSQQTAKTRGIDLSGLRARQATVSDFETFDYILAMDAANHRDLLEMCPTGREDRLHLFLKFAPELGRLDVPDPYYHDGFDGVFDMLEVASKGLLTDIRERHGL
jgi:protein-tyrosine phosphatase